MERTAFIIAEYDPFHNGHALHIRKTREASAETVVVIMSGNFIQRGDIAMCDKSLRTQMALEGGADLVLENPLKYVLSGARYFAEGAIGAIKSTGIKGTISFGASADVDTFKTLAGYLDTQEIQEKIRSISEEKHVPLAYAVQETVAELLPDHADILKDPNNVLAVEYMRAATRKGLQTDWFRVPRDTVPHDGENTFESLASGKKIRSLIYGHDAQYNDYCPETTVSLLEREIGEGSAPADRIKFDAGFYSRLLTLTSKDLVAVNGVSQGFDNRLIDAIQDCTSLQELYDTVKMKRFTHSRVRQAVVSAVLGIKKADLTRENPYLRVLGFSDRGRELLRDIRDHSTVPVVMNLSEAPLSRERTLDETAGKLYDLCRPKPRGGRAEYLVKPVILHATER